MIRRIGFWTLLIASALWAQGCAHSKEITTLEDTHKALQGLWQCEMQKLLDQNTSSQVKSLISITDHQIIEESTFTIKKLFSKEPEYMNSQIKWLMAYKLLDEKTLSKKSISMHHEILSSSNNTEGKKMVGIAQETNQYLQQNIVTPQITTQSKFWLNENTLLMQDAPNSTVQNCKRIN